MLGYEFQLVVSDRFTSSVAADAMPTKVQHWDIDEASGNMGFGGDAPGAAEAAGYRFHKAADFPAGISGVTNYAAAETPTGGTWIDGKRVYRTVISSPPSFNFTGSAGTRTLGTIADVETVLSIGGAVLLSDTWCPVSYSHEDTAWNMAVYIDQATGNVNLTKGTKGTITAYAVIVEYTKTS